MNKTEICDKARNILIDVLNLSEETENDKLTRTNIAEWDSLKHISLIAEIETAFDIIIEPEEIVEMTSIKSIVEIINKKKLK